MPGIVPGGVNKGSNAQGFPLFVALLVPSPMLDESPVINVV
jgi:hypothetical protein